MWAHLPDILPKPQIMSVIRQISASLLSHYKTYKYLNLYKSNTAMTRTLLFLYTHHLFNTHSTEMQVSVSNWNRNNNFVLEALILFTCCINKSTDKCIRESLSCDSVRCCNVLCWMILDLNAISKVCPHLLCRCHCHFKHGKYSGDCIRNW